MHHRRLRAGACAVVILAAAGGPAVTPAPAVAATAATAPQIETLLPGGVGDGGPATDALVNATQVARAADGDLIVTDVSGVRRVDADTGIITADTGLAALPEASRGIGSVTGAWPTAAGVFYRLESDAQVWVVRVAGEDARELLRGPRTGNDRVRVLTVGPDGGIVLARGGESYAAPESTEVLRPDGTWSKVAAYAATVAAAAADGTVFLGASSQIARVRPDGTTDVVGGPGPTRYPAPDPPDGWPATDVPTRAGALAVTPAGDRLVFAETALYTGGQIVRTFPVGGAITTIAGGQDHTTSVCPRAVSAVLADPEGALVACGGVRSYAYDGTQRPRAGAVVAGRNAAPGTTDSPSGTPLARAYLGYVLDLERIPDGRPAIVTRGGVYTVEGSGGDATLVRLLDSGLDPAALPNERDPRSVYEDYAAIDAAFGPDGTLFMLTPTPAGAYRLIARSPQGEVRTLSEGGTTEPAAGVPLTGARLAAGHITVRADGLHLALGERVWRVDGESGALVHVAGDPAGTARTDVAATSAQTYGIGWLGSDPRTGDLLVDDGSLRRVDAAGTMRFVSVMGGEGHAFGADGSVYSTEIHSRTVWRHRPDGSRVAALGQQPFGSGYVGIPMDRPLIGDGPDGRLLVADLRTPSSYVALVRPGEPTFSGPAPTLNVQASFGYEGRVVVRVTAPTGRGRWHVETRAGSDPARLKSADAHWFYETDVAAGASYEETIVAYSDRYGANASPSDKLAPYAQFSVALYAWPEDASSAPPPVIAKAAVPGRPLHIPVTKATASVAYGGTVTVTGTLLRNDKTPIPGRPVDLEARRKGSTTWARVATVTSGGDGGLRATHKPTRNTEYRWVHRPNSEWAGYTGPIDLATVRPKLTATAPATARTGATVAVSGTLSPTVAGRTASLQRYLSGTWKTVTTGKIGSTGKVAIKTKVTSAKTYTFRLSVPAATDLAAATSPSIKIKVTRA